jgi:hypothetical protein
MGRRKAITRTEVRRALLVASRRVGAIERQLIATTTRAKVELARVYSLLDGRAWIVDGDEWISASQAMIIFGMDRTDFNRARREGRIELPDPVKLEGAPQDNRFFRLGDVIRVCEKRRRLAFALAEKRAEAEGPSRPKKEIKAPGHLMGGEI